MNHERFLELYGTRTGRWLANRLGLSGPGSEGLANLLSSYAWNMRAAETLRRVNEMKARPSTGNVYAEYCNRLIGEIKSHKLWPVVSRRFDFT